MRKGNKFFLKSPRPSLPLKRAPPLTPTLSPSGKREETAPPRRSEPLRSKVGGPKRSSPDCAGWDRLGKTGGRWFFLTHSNMFEVDICGFVIRSFHFFWKLLQ